jgi:hypothetical protein
MSQTMPEYGTVYSYCIHNIHNNIIYTAPPGELRIRHRTPTSAQLSWTPVPKNQQNGVITGYTVQITGPDFIRKISITDATTTSTEVSGLRPGTSYYFSLSARTVAGTGQPMRSLTITPQGGKAMSC